VWRVLREHEISLERRRSWCISTDPAFAQKAAVIVALYLQPPENAVVLSVDEKPHIQALERAQGWLKLPNGKALTGFNHEYKRHGTTTLFAALDVVTGLVKAGHYRRRRRVEFLHFMNRVVVDHLGREIHVILDNLNTHKPKHDCWLARHKNIHFHFTPTHASWLIGHLVERRALVGDHRAACACMFRIDVAEIEDRTVVSVGSHANLLRTTSARTGRSWHRSVRGMRR
jgi:hypothetical protein